MTLVPDWFEDNFVNVEDVLIDLFTVLLTEVDVGCWYADDWLDEAEPDPQLLFYRLPGARVNYDSNSDVCNVQVIAVSGSRDTSWTLMSFVRAILLPMQGFRAKFEDYTAQIWCSDDVAGPEMLTPGQQIDTRVVSSVLSVRVGLNSRKRYMGEVSDALAAALIPPDPEVPDEPPVDP